MLDSNSNNSNLEKDDEDLVQGNKDKDKSSKEKNKDDNSGDSSDCENPIFFISSGKRQRKNNWEDLITVTKKKKKKELTELQKDYIKNQKEEFERNFNILKSDFDLLIEYEKNIFKDTNLDLMIIMDLTGSMYIWLNEVKENIKNVIEEITQNNPGSKIRISFIGYRDFESENEVRKYDSKEFTENISEFYEYINTLDCSGGGDLPEDIIGALKLSLNMKWESEAKYALLICDAPCHGKQYHNIFYDKFENGDPDGTSLESVIEQFKLKEITFYCLEIDESTNKMFNIMKNVYNNDEKFHVENLNDSFQLSFFVAFSASMILNNEKYKKHQIKNIIEKYRKDSIELIVKKYIKNDNMIYNEENMENDLIGKIENLQLEGEDKKLLDFVNRMNNLNLNTNSNKTKINNNNITNNINNINDDLISIKLTNSIFTNLESKTINLTIRSLTYNNDPNSLSDWSNPSIQELEFDTNINFIPNNFYENIENKEYNLKITDNKLKKEINCIIPFTIKQEFYNDSHKYIKELSYNEIICRQIADYFNILSKEKIQNYQNINFKRHIIYELNPIQKNIDTINILPEEFCINLKFMISENFNFMNNNKPLEKNILECFSHFSYQISGGQLLISDLEYGNGYITKFKVYKIKNGEYKNIMKFFVSHICNNYCKKLELIHPRKKNNEGIKDEFYSQRYLTNTKLCECCKIPLNYYEFIEHDNKIYCSFCYKFVLEANFKDVCKKCSKNFFYSTYEYNTKLENYPNYCPKCENSFYFRN